MVTAKPVIGWREWIELPGLSTSPVKAKIDTGARTSALHAHDMRVRTVDGVSVVSFELHPQQRSARAAVKVERHVESFREIRSSNGKIERRPVIIAIARLGTIEWPIEVTLTSRDEMGFRMLLGRAAVRRRFLVDPGRSYVFGKNSKTSEK